jgi:16S rRNA (cytosine1402-N4)-methyltransferase
VLEDHVIDYLAIDEHGIYIDATFGRGGHTASILAQLSPLGRLICIDKDLDAIEHARAKYANDERVLIHHGCFSEIELLCKQLGCHGSVDGVLFDLGVSSPQLDTPERGFSFSQDGPLDMRMDQSTGYSASEWLNEASKQEIADILKRFGEERYALRIAQNIIESRVQTPITRTQQLVNLITQSLPRHDPYKHPATRSFQAIRIHVNQELQTLEKGLAGSLNVLNKEGRLCAISFQSLEDRIVKRFMKAQSQAQLPKRLPVVASAMLGRLRLIAKKIRANEQEQANNPRSRSATLRVAQKLG